MLKKTREDFFDILQAINKKIWIPYHVGLEYQRRRLEVIKNEKAVFNDIEDNLKKIQNVFKGDFERLALKRRFPKLFENTEKLEKEIEKSISKYKKSVQSWDDEQPCVRSHDEVRDRLNELFDQRVGDKPKDQKWLDDLYREGENRFNKKIPPGFKDVGKGGADDESCFVYDGLYYQREYGDLIVWKQLIEKSKSDDVKHVVFVTDDAKEDWWYKIRSKGEKTIGPLAELQAEIYRESNIKNFHMYRTSMFLEDGKSNLAVDVSESSIEDASAPHVNEKIHRLPSRQLSDLMDLYGAPSVSSERFRDLQAHISSISAHHDKRREGVVDAMDGISPREIERWKEISNRINSIAHIDEEQLAKILGRKRNDVFFDIEEMSAEIRRLLDLIEKGYDGDEPED